MLSCNDPLQIGADLVEDSDVNFVNTDTITIEATTVQLDSTIAYQAPSFIFTSQKLGWVNDPIFGGHKSELFVQILPENFSRPKGTVDSIFLAIQYDTLDVYGDINALHNIEVFSLFGKISRLGTFYTDDILITPISLGAVTGLAPTTQDSIDIIELDNSGDLDTIRVPNQMRFKLDNFFGNSLLSIDSSSYTAIDTFLDVFGGMLIRPTVASGGMLPLRASNANSTGGLRNSKVSLFYTNTDGDPRQYDYLIGGATFSLHDHDYSSGTIIGSIGDHNLSKDLLYIQGAGGPSISVKFPYINTLKDIVVNEAILELTTELLPQDDRTMYPLPAQMFTSYRRDSTIVLTADVNTALQAFRDVDLVGGKPEEITSASGTRIVYRFNISDHIQSMINGSVRDEIFIQLSENSTGVQRAIFKGINDPDSPIKLKITYTEI